MQRGALIAEVLATAPSSRDRLVRPVRLDEGAEAQPAAAGTVRHYERTLVSAEAAG